MPYVREQDPITGKPVYVLEHSADDLRHAIDANAFRDDVEDALTEVRRLDGGLVHCKSIDALHAHLRGWRGQSYATSGECYSVTLDSLPALCAMAGFALYVGSNPSSSYVYLFIVNPH